MAQVSDVSTLWSVAVLPPSLHSSLLLLPTAQGGRRGSGGGEERRYEGRERGRDSLLYSLAATTLIPLSSCSRLVESGSAWLRSTSPLYARAFPPISYILGASKSRQQVQQRAQRLEILVC